MYIVQQNQKDCNTRAKVTEYISISYMYIHESNVCTLITYETRSIYGPNCPLLQNRKSSEKFKCAG